MNMFANHKTQCFLVAGGNDVESMAQAFYPSLTVYCQIDLAAFGLVVGVLMPGAALIVKRQVVYRALGIVTLNSADTVANQNFAGADFISKTDSGAPLASGLPAGLM